MLPTHITRNLLRSTASWLFSFGFLLVILFSPNTACPVDVTLAWDANTEENLAGYSVFCREQDEDYDYGAPAWEAEIIDQDKLPNPNEPTCTIYELDEDTTYYFVARTFDTSGNESGDSNEVCIITFSETYEVSGRITEGGDGVDGVAVELTGELPWCVPNHTITSGGGYYTLDVPDGDYTVTPSSSSYEFTPPDRAMTVSGADVPDQDFTSTWTWSGEIIVDNLNAEFLGDWGASATGGYGDDYRWHAAGDGSCTATWIPDLPAADYYNVYVWWKASSNRATDTKYTICYEGGSETVEVNQEIDGSQWNLLGTYPFVAGQSGYVVLSDDADQYIIADAVKFEP